MSIGHRDTYSLEIVISGSTSRAAGGVLCIIAASLSRASITESLVAGFASIICSPRIASISGIVVYKVYVRKAKSAQSMTRLEVREALGKLPNVVLERIIR